MRLQGANKSPNITGQEQLVTRTSYFIGNDSKQWHKGIHNYGKVKYEAVYPGIDQVYYGTNQRQLEYDFVVAPGANPGAIKMRFEGAERIELAETVTWCYISMVARCASRNLSFTSK